MVKTSSSMIIDGLKFYTEEMLEWEDDINTLFDEMYFLFILKRRYKEIFRKFTLRDQYQLIEERMQEVSLSIKQIFSDQRAHLINKNLFEKSQFWFNFMGFNYLEALENDDYSVDLKKSELKEIQQGYGYSATYDFMMTFFLEKLNQTVKGKKESVPSKNEEIYIATHKFLLESDYFTKENQVADNIEELFSFLAGVLADRNEDLLAEVLWALNYFLVDEFPQRQEMETILASYLFNLKNYKNSRFSREKRHTVYACILSFMENELRVADKKWLSK